MYSANMAVVLLCSRERFVAVLKGFLCEGWCRYKTQVHALYHITPSLRPGGLKLDSIDGGGEASRSDGLRMLHTEMCQL